VAAGTQLPNLNNVDMLLSRGRIDFVLAVMVNIGQDNVSKDKDQKCVFLSVMPDNSSPN
jgi:hypothetical protein